MATYPSGIYAPRTMANRAGVSYDVLKTKVIFAEDFNLDRAEITAIETELGTLPKGGFASVKVRLEDIEADVATIPVKATGVEINTGTDDAKFATPKAIADSNIAFLSDIPSVPVKATGVEINTGTDDAKFATPKAIADSNVFRSEKAAQISGLTDKPIPVDADVVVIDDSAVANAKKKLTWANIKATLKTYFDTLYATTTYKFRAYKSADLTVVTATLTDVVFDTENFDPGADYDNTTGDYTVPVTGYYLIQSGFGYDPCVAAKLIQCRIRKNGAIVLLSNVHTGITTSNISVLSGILYLAADDVIDVQTYHTFGVNGTFKGTTYSAFFAAHLLSI